MKTLKRVVATIGIAGAIGAAAPVMAHAGTNSLNPGDGGGSSCQQWVRMFWSPNGGFGPFICIR